MPIVDYDKHGKKIVNVRIFKICLIFLNNWDDWITSYQYFKIAGIKIISMCLSWP